MLVNIIYNFVKDKNRLMKLVHVWLKAISEALKTHAGFDAIRQDVLEESDSMWEERVHVILYIKYYFHRYFLLYFFFHYNCI